MKRGPTQNMMTTLPNFRSHSGIPWRIGSFIYSSDQETQPHVSCHSEELRGWHVLRPGPMLSTLYL